MRKIYLACIMAGWGATLGQAAPVNDILYATVNDSIEIRKSTLRGYVKNNPYFTSLVRIPGGPMKILDDMIKLQVLVLEGRSMGLPEPGYERGGDAAYAIMVRNRLISPCDRGTEAEIREFFESNVTRFSTPAYLRMNRFGLKFTAVNQSDVEERLHRIGQQIGRGEISFASLSMQSEDEISRLKNGDIGFVADDDPKNPVMDILRNARIGEVVGPIPQGQIMYLYQVTEKRDPVKENFESIKPEVAKAQQEACSRERSEKVFDALKARWKVNVLVKDISVKPGEE